LIKVVKSKCGKSYAFGNFNCAIGYEYKKHSSCIITLKNLSLEDLQTKNMARDGEAIDEQRPLLSGEEPTYNAASTTEAQPGFGKQLNALNGYALLIGCIIGSGIFASPAAVDTNVPSPGAALLIWLVGGLLAWTGAAALAELGTALPGEGSIQEYLKYVYGDFAGFLAAFAWVVAITPSTLSLLSIVFIETVYSAANPASEGTASGWGYKGLSILVLGINVLLNCINTKTSARLGNFFAAIKLLSVALPVLAGLIVALIYAVDHSKDYTGKDWHDRGWFSARPSVTPGGTTDWNKVSAWDAFGFYSAAIYASLWAYCGWDGANYVAAELQDPGRQLPLALNTAIPTVIVSYVLVNAAYYILLPWDTVGLTDAIAVVCSPLILKRCTPADSLYRLLRKHFLGRRPVSSLPS
jgi:amino acid transporter